MTVSHLIQFFLDYYHIISHIIRFYYHLSILGTFFQGRSDRGQVTGVKSRWLSVLVFFWVRLGFFSITTLLFGGIKWYKDGNNLHRLDISPTMARKTSEKNIEQSTDSSKHRPGLSRLSNCRRGGTWIPRKKASSTFIDMFLFS